jgi:hypothetical protein
VSQRGDSRTHFEGEYERGEEEVIDKEIPGVSSEETWLYLGYAASAEANIALTLSIVVITAEESESIADAEDTCDGQYDSTDEVSLSGEQEGECVEG